jgi:hypothetical protein
MFTVFLISLTSLFKAVLRIRDVYPGSPDPDFYPSLIPDPGSKNRYKREG